MTKKYEVSETAGDFVAGQRSPGKGQIIELTDEQAEHPMLLGDIIEPAAKTLTLKSSKD